MNQFWFICFAFTVFFFLFFHNFQESKSSLRFVNKRICFVFILYYSYIYDLLWRLYLRYKMFDYGFLKNRNIHIHICCMYIMFVHYTYVHSTFPTKINICIKYVYIIVVKHIHPRTCTYIVCINNYFSETCLFVHCTQCITHAYVRQYIWKMNHNGWISTKVTWTFNDLPRRWIIN